jgi:hypothetical protein
MDDLETIPIPDLDVTPRLQNMLHKLERVFRIVIQRLYAHLMNFLLNIWRELFSILKCLNSKDILRCRLT